MDTKIPDAEGSEKMLTVHNAYFYAQIPVTRVVNTVEMLKHKTRANTIQTAIELTNFPPFAPLPENEREDVSILITVIACTQDGDVAPPFDIEEFYASIALPP